MNATIEVHKTETGLLEKVGPVRMFSSSALHAARYFLAARSDSSLLRLADEFQADPELPAVAVLDAAGRVIGIVRRDRLFALLGKPFGREVLMKSSIGDGEIVEEVPSFDARTDLFTVAAQLLPDAAEGSTGARDGGGYCLLVGEDGRFLGLLSAQDLANYLSRMTRDDIELAGRLQERLMGGALASIAGTEREADWRIEAWSRSAKGVGGDFYFTRPLEDGKVFFALCDVSGKGVAAALVVSMVWGMLRMFDYSRGLHELLVGLNEAVVSTFHLEKYLTGMFLIYDPGERRLLCADMGHSHAALFRGDRILSLRAPQGNLPIGVEIDIDPSIAPYRIAPGDRLLIYSDGLTEQEGVGTGEFGEGRLCTVAAGAMARGAPLKEAIPEALDKHRGATPQQDDMSFILLTVEPNRPQSDR
jgi:phosphoserine phosphatase RsbU/P